MEGYSFLFVPGDRPERFDKALASGAHAVILDLEDAVLPAAKEAARAAVRAWLAQAPQPVVLRVNAPATPWHEEDCGLLSLPAVAAVMVPKAEDPAQLARFAAALPGRARVIALVESAAAYFAAPELARVPGVARLAFGSVDFMADSGIRADAGELDAVRLQLVLASRAAGLAAPLDGVTLAVDDAAQLERDVQRARRLGMGGKMCIHPRQVAAVHAAFAPSARELDWARRVLDALAAGGHGAVTVDGKLVDRPVELMARSLLAAEVALGLGSPAARHQPA